MFERTEITSSGPNVDGKEVTLTNTVELRGKLNAHLLQYMKLEWLGPQGVSMTTSNGITIGTQALTSERTTLDLFFDPLSTDHGGLYRCIVSISIPSLDPYFRKELRYQMTVISKERNVHSYALHSCLYFPNSLSCLSFLHPPVSQFFPPPFPPSLSFLYHYLCPSSSLT